ncbi:hypothetical protein pb186bvf_008628 [Paramecium bursaria]
MAKIYKNKLDHDNTIKTYIYLQKLFYILLSLMIKFSNQNEHYNSPPNYQGQKVYPQQQQRPQKANNSGYMQETFGHPSKPPQQQQYPNYQQQDQRYLYEQQKRQQQTQQNQNQTVYQQILQQQQQQLKPPYPAKPQTLPDNNPPKKQQVPGSAQNERQNSAYTQGPQVQNHQQRLPSADPSIIQNRSQLQQQVLESQGKLIFEQWSSYNIGQVGCHLEISNTFKRKQFQQIQQSKADRH